ncbi:MAG: sulfide/dihydroorotate dehydrogenase-like FAD/NAD-binding protein [Nitrospirota bacterium]
MAKIIEKKILSQKTILFVIEAPDIAKKHRPGQFVILRRDDRAERIPITIADSDRERGTITIICQEIGKSTRDITSMEKGDEFLDLVGPLGKPTHIGRFGSVVCIAGGFGVATINPIAKGLKENGNRIIIIMGARTRELLIWEEQMRKVADAVYITTDDGSYGKKGLVTDELKRLIDADENIGLVITVGPIPMMKAVCNLTKEREIKTYASLNPIMLDGTGMCGGCRVTVGGKVKFACVDGPEFDGHIVDFDELNRRNKIYIKEERCMLEGIGD